MLKKKDLSEAAQWFLEDFQGLLESFAAEEGVQVTLLDKEGEVIVEIEGPQKICKLIRADTVGRTKCEDGYRMGFTLAKSRQEPILVNCFAGFVSVWLPIMVKGAVIGVIVACGKRSDLEDNREKLIESFSQMSDELGIMDREGFLRAALDEVEIINQKEAELRASKLDKLISILEETARTPLKEIFG